MKDKERQQAEQNSGAEAGRVHRRPGRPGGVRAQGQSAGERSRIEELAEIYGDDGTITKWSQLGVQNKLCDSDEITRVSRQNNSGTYQYFREAVLGEGREYKLGSIDQSGSKDLVALVSRTPCAIGYSGMGYHTAEVKWLKVAKKKGEPGWSPAWPRVKDGSYPIARPLFIYTLGEPTRGGQGIPGLDPSAAGQKIVVELGYVPLDDVPPAAAARRQPADEVRAGDLHGEPAAAARSRRSKTE